MIAKTQHLEQALRWDDLRVLLALSRHGRLKEAGTELGVNASTVSRRLDALEDALSTPLFDRTGGGLAPTAALEQLLPHAEAVESAVAELLRTAAGFETEPAGTVRITAPPGLVEHFLTPLMAELRERYPRLRLELEGTIGYADLTRREADIALRAVRPERGDLVAVLVAEDTDTVLGAAEYVAELGVLKRLDDARWIQWDRDLAHFSSARWLEDQVSPDAIWLRTSHMGAQVEAAERGVGLVVMPTLYEGVHGLVRAKLSPALRGKLRPFAAHQLWLVGHRALRTVPRVAVTWDFLLERLRQVPEPGRSRGRP